ncbi:hypothetical protein LZ023_38220 (plasmid) [Pseudomonas silvicola]|nr:hypothetical protein LZ023_38220 [Pseudomonas silvicola]
MRVIHGFGGGGWPVAEIQAEISSTPFFDIGIIKLRDDLLTIFAVQRIETRYQAR